MNEQPSEAPIPPQDELWRRNRLAASLLNQRKPTVETITLALRALRGEDIETLIGSGS